MKEAQFAHEDVQNRKLAAEVMVSADKATPGRRKWVIIRPGKIYGGTDQSVPRVVCRTSVLVLLIVLTPKSVFSQNTVLPPSKMGSAPAAPANAAILKEPSPASEPALTPPAALTQEQIKALINETADKYVENDKRLRDYTYVQREEERKLNSKGEVKSVESRTSEVIILYHQKVERLIAKNDQPLSEKEKVKYEEKIQKAALEGNLQLPGFVLRRHLEQQEIGLTQNRDYMREVISGYDYKLIGMENLEGRETYVIDGDPRPGYQPRHKDAKLLLCFRFRIWIDKAESQWVKLDAQYINIFPFGLFPVRLHMGSRAFLEATRVNDEIWLPKYVDVKVDARLGLVKGFYEELEVKYHDYKKFRTDSKITAVREARGQR